MEFIYEFECARVKVSQTLSAPLLKPEEEKRGSLIEEVELLGEDSGEAEEVMLLRAAGATFPAPPRPME